MNATLNQETSNAQGSQTARRQNFVAPEVNIFETQDGYVLEAEMPGVNKEGLDITLEANELTIVGRRHRAQAATAPVYRESSAADYRRVFELDPAIDPARVNARINQGVLTLHLPKSEKVKPRKVTISD